MGPGFFPLALCILLAAFGAALITAAFLVAPDTGEPWRLRPLAMILAAVSAFAILLETAGLAAALLTSGALAALASRESRARETAVLLVIIVAGSILLFIVALGLPFRVLPREWF